MAAELCEDVVLREVCTLRCDIHIHKTATCGLEVGLVGHQQTERRFQARHFSTIVGTGSSGILNKAGEVIDKKSAELSLTPPAAVFIGWVKTTIVD